MINPSLTSVTRMLLGIASIKRLWIRNALPLGSTLLLGSELMLGTATLLSSNWALGHDGEDHEHKPRQVKPAEMFAPSNIPDRVILTFAADPTTSQAVTWRTSTEIEKGFAEIAVATHGPEFEKQAVRVEATTAPLKTDLNTAHYHSVVFKDLKPGTKYAYRVGDSVNWSEWFHFTTATHGDQPFSFIYFGDAQNNLRSHWSRVIREAYSDAPKARFMLHAGDLINTAESDAEWGEWFGAGAWINATIPNVPVVGNHEQHKREDGVRELTRHWRPQFTLPEQAPAGLEETVYSFDYQNAKFIILNSNLQQAEQAVWLEKELSENTNPWVIVSFHHPIFSTAKDRDNAALRKTWKPILDKYRVDLVLQGHDHSYGRTGLSTPVDLAKAEGLPAGEVTNEAQGLTKYDEHYGTVYVVSVSGPKMYNVDPKPFMVRMGEDTQLYQIITLEGTKLTYEARTAVGELYDTFELHKEPGSANRLVEGEPKMAQRRRPPTPATP